MIVHKLGHQLMKHFNCRKVMSPFGLISVISPFAVHAFFPSRDPRHLSQLSELLP
jgi:hypothetical protein